MDSQRAIIQTGIVDSQLITAVDATGEIRPCSHPLCKQLVFLPEDAVLVAWLDAKTRRSGSPKTHMSYHDTVISFKQTLKSYGLQFDSDPERIALLAQGWAAQRSPQSPREGEVSPATYSQRLAVISSLYQWAKKQRLYKGDNPIEFIERPKVQPYANAHGLDSKEVNQVLTQIDTETDDGKRDLVILAIGFTTGHRVSAIASLRWRNVSLRGKKAHVHFDRLKGGEVADVELEVSTTRALLEYLHSYYGQDLGSLSGDAPLWVSFSHNESRGRQISAKALENICRKWTGSGKFHLTRHSFAYNMEEAGATTSEIQEALRHKNIATTGLYLKRVKRPQNKHARKLELMYGLEDEEGEE